MKFHYDDKIKDTEPHDEIHMLTLHDQGYRTTRLNINDVIKSMSSNKCEL